MFDLVFIGNQIETPDLKSLNIVPDSLLKCRGEIGDFRLTYQTETGKTTEVKTSTIVINTDAEMEKPFADLPSFTDELKIKEGDVLIFVQDYQTLSPAIMSSKGLERCISVVREFPDLQVYYFYRSMRFINDNDKLYEEARKEGIVFLKYEEGSLSINASSSEISYQREDISLKLQGKIIVAPTFKPLESLKRIARILNLEMGPGGFLQPENVYLQPTLSGRRGVYLLGGSRGPTAFSSQAAEIEYTLNEIEYSIQDIKPLVSDLREVDDQKCILCYTCYRVCPHGAIERDEKLDAMKVLNLACQGCNNCISHCPASAISIVETDQEEVKPGLRVMMCENSAWTSWEKLEDKERFSDLVLEKIPCAGCIEKEDIYHYLRNPGDRILILGCFEESCKHFSGDRRASRIVNEVNERLKALNLGENRVIFKQLAPRMEEDLADLLSHWKEGKL
jgi:Pyruvate/2-oxoacid:ferredoxin oxidoreductase delta subunit/coenzyme F420-reducing hydrogenase delta subunit